MGSDQSWLALSLLGTHLLSDRAPISPMPFCISGCIWTYILSHSLTCRVPWTRGSSTRHPKGVAVLSGVGIPSGVTVPHSISGYYCGLFFLPQNCLKHTGAESPLFPSKKLFVTQATFAVQLSAFILMFGAPDDSIWNSHWSIHWTSVGWDSPNPLLSDLPFCWCLLSAMKFTVCPSQFVFPLSFLVVHLIATTGSLDRTLIDASFFGAGVASQNLNTSQVGRGSWFRGQGCSILEGLVHIWKLPFPQKFCGNSVAVGTYLHFSCLFWEPSNRAYLEDSFSLLEKEILWWKKKKDRELIAHFPTIPLLTSQPTLSCPGILGPN